MVKTFYFCESCNEYTLKEDCCNKKTINKTPPKYSPDDKYASYRKDIKKKEWVE